MFNGAKKAQDPSYLFDLTKYYKIWFSTMPNQFLGMEEQLRFIRMREDNPESVLHFIFSKACLSEIAIQKLNEFCAQYKIKPIAFEDLEPALLHDQDKALYTLAQQEIVNCIAGKEGNMGAASDCVRLLVPVIERYGNYGDFDVRIRLSTLGATYVTLRGPLLFPAETLVLNQQAAILSPNSDFFACSFDQNNHEQLSRDALGAIRRLQAVVLQKYRTAFAAEKLFGLNKLTAMKNYPELPELFAEFHRRYPHNPTVYDFRTYLKSLPDLPAPSADGISVKTFLIRVSVINMSGPGNYPFLFAHLFPKGVKEPSLLLPYRDPKWLPFMGLYERCSTGFYDPIYDAIDSKNSAVKAVNMESKGAMESKGGSKNLAEFSWTQDGMNVKQKREQIMLHSALQIQGFWRRKLETPCYKLYKEVKQINSLDAILEPIKRNQMALALRRACSGIKLDVVKLLVDYYQKHPFNVNEISATNPNTALDWIMKAKPADAIKKGEQQEIIQLLISVGAKRAEEFLAQDLRKTL